MFALKINCVILSSNHYLVPPLSDSPTSWACVDLYFELNGGMLKLLYFILAFYSYRLRVFMHSCYIYPNIKWVFSFQLSHFNCNNPVLC